MKHIISLTAYLLCVPACLAAAPVTARINFNRDIRPILANNCFQCHGPDAKQRAAELRLDQREGALAPRKAGAAVVPGKSAASALVHRITAADAAERMPPADSGKKLSAQQIDLLKRWIDQGAEWQGHWSFLRAERSPLPTVRKPGVVNPIDRFILARLEAEGLTLSPEADKVTLIRRVALDLTGLPPTPQEVDAFLADRSPEAYEKLVDRLLASPRYGEHMARSWLDLARFGDTHGLHFDNERALWRYRDWVLGAFNRNLSYDRFVTEQIAGDLLPNATAEQKIATGFNRCNVSTNEGGSINEEVLVRYAVDRTETMGTVFMGLTLGCAVCHDHKFDPVSQKEFYRLLAFFNSAADAAMDGNILAPPPILRMATPDQEVKLRALDEKTAAVRKRVADLVVKTEYTDPGAAGTKITEPREFVWIDDAAPAGAKLLGDTPWEFVSAPKHPVLSGTKSTRRSAKGISQHYFEGASPGLTLGQGDVLFAHVWIDPKDPPKEVMLQFNDGTWEHRAYWGADSIPWGFDGSSRRYAGPLPKSGEWVRLEIEAAKVGLNSGAVLNGWAFTQFGGTVYWDKAGVLTRTPQSGKNFESLAAWEAYERAQAKSPVPQPVRDALKVLAGKRTEAQTKLIRDYYLERICPRTRPTFDPLTRELDAIDKEKKDLDALIPVTMVMADLPQPRDTFVLIRGQYDKHGEKVVPGVPASLPPLPAAAPPNRIGLARWLVDPAHPLTARVAVNRYWQQCFGRGLVKTSEDFGVQGEWPSHPELLDWLAVEFVESGWDVKQLMKRIVTSAAYRQSSDVSATLLRRDPENVLLARGPRFRLDAEVLRDSALYISGLLREQVGGRSVRPYQPSGIWEAVGFSGSNTQTFKRDSGAGLYRRSVYTFWKRTAPPPALMAFDAPSRETCVARRSRTNTPLQALAMMNDEQYVEAARHLAERMMTTGGATPAERLTFAFRQATARRPEKSELDVLLRVFERQLAHYRKDTAAAEKLLAVGESPRNKALDAAEQAAYTMAANLILNLDETITKE